MSPTPHLGCVHRALRRCAVGLRPGRHLTAALAAALLAVQPLLSHAEPAPSPPYPRLANFYLQGSVDEVAISALARYDLVVLNSVWTDAQLAQLRALNPGIEILLYVCAYCTEVPPNPRDTWNSANYDYARANDLWWYTQSGAIASDWPRVELMNITDLGPAGPDGKWRDYIARRVPELLQARPQADGVFFDNFWAGFSWQQARVQVDSDCNPTHNPAGCDGVMDAAAQVDTLWNRALRGLAQQTRASFDVLQASRPGRPLVIVGNRATDYFPWLNGAFYERFAGGWTGADTGNPYGYSWNQDMFANPGGYLVAPFRSSPQGSMQILNDSAYRARSAADSLRHRRFTLVSALLGDGYFSLENSQLEWEPEFDAAGRQRGYLGRPLGPMYRVGVPAGPEMLQNGDFGAGTGGWRGQASGAVASFGADTAVYRSAPSAARAVVSSVGPGGYYKISQSPIDVVQGRGYTLAFWAQASVPQDVVVHLYSELCPGNRCLGDRSLRIGTAWERFEVPFVAAGTAGAGLDFTLKVPGTVWIDDVSLREGDASLYRRDFERGTVLLNYTTATQSVALGRTYYRLDIPGSPVFDGAAVAVETVPPSDGRILLATPLGPSQRPPEARGALYQNEPNPFNPQTRIRFLLRRAEPVHLAVYDVAGRLVRLLVDRPLGAGERSVNWDGKDRFGLRTRSGAYFCRIATPSFRAARRMTLVK